MGIGVASSTSKLKVGGDTEITGDLIMTGDGTTSGRILV